MNRNMQLAEANLPQRYIWNRALNSRLALQRTNFEDDGRSEFWDCAYQKLEQIADVLQKWPSWSELAEFLGPEPDDPLTVVFVEQTQVRS